MTMTPMAGTVPYFEPANIAGARDLVLVKAPSRMLIGPHPKT